jgi:hypothetical protein
MNLMEKPMEYFQKVSSKYDSYNGIFLKLFYFINYMPYYTKNLNKILMTILTFLLSISKIKINKIKCRRRCKIKI